MNADERRLGRQRVADRAHRNLSVAERCFAKCRRTLAAIWRSVMRSTVSTAAMRPPGRLLARRVCSSPLASPGPNIRIASASPITTDLSVLGAGLCYDVNGSPQLTPCGAWRESLWLPASPRLSRECRRRNRQAAGCCCCVLPPPARTGPLMPPASIGLRMSSTASGWNG